MDIIHTLEDEISKQQSCGYIFQIMDFDQYLNLYFLLYLCMFLYLCFFIFLGVLLHVFVVVSVCVFVFPGASLHAKG